MYIGLTVKKERKRACTHVDHNQLDPLLLGTLWFDFKTSTILVYMILNGKGSVMWSTRVQACFLSF